MSRQSVTGGVLLLIALAIAWPFAAPGEARAASTKYVIFHQWGGVKVSDVVRNARKLESLPFDGTTVVIPDSGTLMLGGATSYDKMYRDLAPLKGAFSRFTQNFVMIHTRRPPDPFDDWSQEIKNWRNMARAAHAAGLMGIFHDNEPYSEQTWLWPRDVRYPDRSLSSYRDQMRKRGREVMQAMVAEFPEIVVLTFHGPYLSDPRTPNAVTLGQIGGRAEDLRGAFFVGMVEGAGPRSTIVDGGEVYQYRSPQDFQTSYNWRKREMASPKGGSCVVPPSLRASYPQRVSIAFATYNKQWLKSFPMNPEVMRNALANAIRYSDRYVWFYVEGDWVQNGMPSDWLFAVKAAVAAGRSRG